MISFRFLKEEDIEVLPGLALEDWRETYQGFMQDEDIQGFVNEAYDSGRLEAMLPDVKNGAMGFWVAEDESQIVGWLQVSDFGSGMEIGRSSLSGEEVAGGLLGEAEKFLKDQGAKRYFSFVDEDDRDYKITLESFGFKHIKKNDDGTDRYLEKKVS